MADQKSRGPFEPGHWGSSIVTAIVGSLLTQVVAMLLPTQEYATKHLGLPAGLFTKDHLTLLSACSLALFVGLVVLVVDLIRRHRVRLRKPDVPADQIVIYVADFEKDEEEFRRRVCDAILKVLGERVAIRRIGLKLKLDPRESDPLKEALPAKREAQGYLAKHGGDLVIWGAPVIQGDKVVILVRFFSPVHDGAKAERYLSMPDVPLEDRFGEEMGAVLATAVFSRVKALYDSHRTDDLELLKRLAVQMRPLVLEPPDRMTLTARANLMRSYGFVEATIGSKEKDSSRMRGAIDVFDKLAQLFPDPVAPEYREYVANALVNKGITQDELGESAKAIAAYESVEQRFGRDASRALRELVAKALFNKGVAHSKLREFAKAIAAYKLVAERFGGDASPALRELVAMALFNKGVAHGELEESAKEIAAYELADKRFGGDASPVLRELVAMALYNKGVVHGELGEFAKAIAAFELVEQRFGGDATPALREWVAMALVNKGVAHSRLGESAKEIAAYELTDKRFGGDASPALREQVAKALVNKAVTYEAMGEVGLAVATCREVVRRYEEDLSLEKWVGMAREMLARLEG